MKVSDNKGRVAETLSTRRWSQAPYAMWEDRSVARGCEISDCGVVAAGLCESCRRAFCDTHRKRTSHGRSYSNLCRDCSDPVKDRIDEIHRKRVKEEFQQQLRSDRERSDETREKLGRLVGLMVGHFPDETIPLIAEVTWEVPGLFGSKKREGYAVVERLWPLGIVGEENRFALGRSGLCFEPEGTSKKLVHFERGQMRVVNLHNGNHHPSWSRIETIERLEKMLRYRGVALD